MSQRPQDSRSFDSWKRNDAQTFVAFQRFARYCVEAYTLPEEHKTRWEWIDALDETLSDLARSVGVEPKVTLRGVIEELAGAA